MPFIFLLAVSFRLAIWDWQSLIDPSISLKFELIFSFLFLCLNQLVQGAWHTVCLAENFQTRRGSLLGKSIPFRESCLQTLGALEQLQLCLAVIWEARERLDWLGNKWYGVCNGQLFCCLCIYWKSVLFDVASPFPTKCFVACSEAPAESCCGTRLLIWRSKGWAHSTANSMVTKVSLKPCPKIHPGKVFQKWKDDSSDKSQWSGNYQSNIKGEWVHWRK